MFDYVSSKVTWLQANKLHLMALGLKTKDTGQMKKKNRNLQH